MEESDVRRRGLLLRGDGLQLGKRVGRHGAFGKRRALVGRMRLVAEEGDPARVAPLAQAQRRARAGLAGADHDHPARVGQPGQTSIRTWPPSRLTG